MESTARAMVARLRATGHTASDQVETVLYRIVASGAPGKIDWSRADAMTAEQRRAAIGGGRDH